MSVFANARNDALYFWVWLGVLSGITPLAAKRLLDAFGSPQEIWGKSESSLVSKGVVGSRDLPKLLDINARNSARSLTDRILDGGADITHIYADDYPPLLAHISDPPLVLFRRGRRNVFGSSSENATGAVAVVGSRHPTYYGAAVSKDISSGLATYGLVVVSGMAMGVDAAAHVGAMSTGGMTAAFLGCGVDIAYPSSNRKLMGEIMENGAVYSEYPPGTPPAPHRFPQRNRLISGSSLATVIVEAAERSGALITASCAAEQGRDVFAIPGNITSRLSKGSNALLRDGAGVATSAADIALSIGSLNTHGVDVAKVATATFGGDPDTPAVRLERFSEQIQAVARSVELSGRADIDTIIARAQLDTASVCSALTILEMERIVRKLPGEVYEYI